MKLDIKTKLIIASCLLLALEAFIFYEGSSSLMKANALLNTEIDTTFQKIMLSAQLKNNILSFSHNENKREPTLVSEYNDERELLKETDKIIERSADKFKIEEDIDNAGRKVKGANYRGWITYFDNVNEANKRGIQEQKEQDNGIIIEDFKSAAAGFDRTDLALTSIIQDFQKDLDTYKYQSKQIFLRSKRRGLIILGFGVFLGILIIFWIVSTINGGLKKVKIAISRMSKADFSVKTDENRKDKIGVLMKKIDIMVERLNFYINIANLESKEKLSETNNLVMMQKEGRHDTLKNIVRNQKESFVIAEKVSIGELTAKIEKDVDPHKPFGYELQEARIRNIIQSRKRSKKLLLEMQSPLAERVTIKLTDQVFLEKAVRLVESNIDNSEFDVTDFASNMNVSRSCLHKKLITLIDQSATDFINIIRLKRSKELLATMKFTISEVAYAVGYNDPKYFSRIFKKQFGQAPSDYVKHPEPNRI